LKDLNILPQQAIIDRFPVHLFGLEATLGARLAGWRILSARTNSMDLSADKRHWLV
jgi:hypothetical protein